MSSKSTVVPISMQLKDEKKYDDVVDILDFYEQEIEDIYIKAGVVTNPTETTSNGIQGPTPIAGLSSAPDQPRAHFNTTDDSSQVRWC